MQRLMVIGLAGILALAGPSAWAQEEAPTEVEAPAGTEPLLVSNELVYPKEIISAQDELLISLSKFAIVHPLVASKNEEPVEQAVALANKIHQDITDTANQLHPLMQKHLLKTGPDEDELEKAYEAWASALSTQLGIQLPVPKPEPNDSMLLPSGDQSSPSKINGPSDIDRRDVREVINSTQHLRQVTILQAFEARSPHNRMAELAIDVLVNHGVQSGVAMQTLISKKPMDGNDQAILMGLTTLNNSAIQELSILTDFDWKYARLPSVADIAAGSPDKRLTNVLYDFEDELYAIIDTSIIAIEDGDTSDLEYEYSVVEYYNMFVLIQQGIEAYYNEVLKNDAMEALYSG